MLWPCDRAVTEQHQLKICVNDAYLHRVRDAEAAGMLTSEPGLGKLVLWHAMEHGEEVTEALLRSNGQLAEAGQGATNLSGVIVQLEQLVAEGTALASAADGPETDRGGVGTA
jgi:hypothetical protein